MLRNTERGWGSVAKSFHWLLAVLIVGQLVLGWIAEDMRFSPGKLELFVWHKSIGLTILLLVFLRIAWRLRNPPPDPLTDPGLWETRLATLGHRLLYLLIVAVPLTGWWISETSRIPFRLYWQVPVPDLLPADKAWSELAANIHGALTTLLVVVLVIHVLAALRHHFLLRDATLSRMLPDLRRSGD